MVYWHKEVIITKKKKKKNYEGLDGRANSNETAYGNLSDEKPTKQS